MSKYLKKNQIIIATIALMLIVAGYMNYSMSTKGELSNLEILDSKEYADLGDATLVSGNAIEDEAKNIETKQNEDQYFSKSKLDRDTMYSQMIESYQNVLNNNQLTVEQKNAAQKEIEIINEKKNGIMISENLIKNKGIEDVVIFINNESVDAIIKTEELNEEQVGQIQSIIQRELKVEANDIHISNRK